jgi:hypothetical protein
MEIRDIADLFIEATGKIEFYWNFYTVTVLALIGWLVSTDKVLRPGLKSLITVGYLVFALMNVLGLWGSYTFAEALRQDLLIAAEAAPDTLENARAVLSQNSYDNQKILALFIHAVLGAFVLSVVWFGRFGESASGSDG